jgi:hypothetical protein
MQGVLENGAQLLSSGGQEYDVGVDNSKTPAERLARQKQNLRRRLGSMYSFFLFILNSELVLEEFSFETIISEDVVLT